MKTRRAKQGKQLARGHSCGVVETGDRSQQLGSGALHLTQGRNCCSELNGRVRITVSLFFCGDLSACKCPEKLHFAVGASVSVHSWGGGSRGRGSSCRSAFLSHLYFQSYCVKSNHFPHFADKTDNQGRHMLCLGPQDNTKQLEFHGSGKQRTVQVFPLPGARRPHSVL